MKRVRVGLRATALLSPLTGIGQYARSLALELQKLPDVDLHLFYGGPWSTAVREAPLPGLGHARGAIRRYFPKPHYFFRAVEQFGFSVGQRLRRIELYHEPAFLPLRFSGPVVITAHDLSWYHYPETHPAERVAVMMDLFPKAVQKCAHVLTDAEYVRQEIIETFGIPPEKITAVPLAAREAFRPFSQTETASTLASVGLQHRSFLLCVGTLEPRKNLDTVLQAFAALDPSLRRRFPLAIAGMSGWGTSQRADLLERLVSAGEVKLLGFISDAQLAHLYASAKLLVYPSLYEGFGLPPLEAMQAGTPVIASNASSLPEVVGDAGVLIEPKDVDALRAAIARLIDDDTLWERLARSGLARSATFSWRRCAEQTRDVYRKVANS
jgi:alpha-1,3-rhamnosyl/mannosyltransferase